MSIEKEIKNMIKTIEEFEEESFGDYKYFGNIEGVKIDLDFGGLSVVPRTTIVFTLDRIILGKQYAVMKTLHLQDNIFVSVDIIKYSIIDLKLAMNKREREILENEVKND